MHNACDGPRSPTTECSPCLNRAGIRATTDTAPTATRRRRSRAIAIAIAIAPSPSPSSGALVGLGELLFDVLGCREVLGAREGLGGHEVLGGAPTNVACLAAQLLRGRPDQRPCHVVSAVGRDARGDRALAELASRGVHKDHVRRTSAPTGVVHVDETAEGDVSYRIAADAAWDAVPTTPDLLAFARGTAAVCFGSLAQRSEVSRATVRAFVAHTPPGALRVFDANLRPPYGTAEILRTSVHLANVLKCTGTELPIVLEACGLPSDLRDPARIATSLALDVLAVTHGADGSALWVRGQYHARAAAPVEVVDPVGAGDAFTAALVVGLLRQDPVEAIHDAAARTAAAVCGQRGATPPLSEP